MCFRAQLLKCRFCNVFSYTEHSPFGVTFPALQAYMQRSMLAARSAQASGSSKVHRQVADRGSQTSWLRPSSLLGIDEKRPAPPNMAVVQRI